MRIYEGLRKIAERTEHRTPVAIGFVCRTKEKEFAVVGETQYIGDLAKRAERKNLPGMIVNIYE
ncbi:MAG: hypothetical protein WC613_02075 [Candidatus Aenigmatarchaeota archaeon]